MRNVQMTIEEHYFNLLKEWQATDIEDYSCAFIESIQKIEQFLTTNTYVKQTKNLLRTLIEDAQNKPMFLLVGRTASGKSSFINFLLRQEIMTTNLEVKTAVNTVFCYGEQPKIKAYFFDGQIESFDLELLKFFTDSETVSAKMLRESLDYIEVYLPNPFLEHMSIIDTAPIETKVGSVAHIRDHLLQRANYVFWLTRQDNHMTTSEKLFMQQIEQTIGKPTFILNGFDQQAPEEMVAAIPRLPFVQHIATKNAYGVSVLNAERAIQRNDEALYNKSNIEQILQKMYELAAQNDHKMADIYTRFIQLTLRYSIEVENILVRDPYAQSMSYLKAITANPEQFFNSWKKENEAFITLENELLEIVQTYNNIRTPYQFVQFIRKNLFIKDKELLKHSTKIDSYLNKVRDYRKILTTYEKIKLQLEEQVQKQKKHLLQFFKAETTKIDDVALQRQSEQLAKELRLKYDKLQQERQQVMAAYVIQKETLEMLVQEEVNKRIQLILQIISQQKGQMYALESTKTRLVQFEQLQNTTEAIILILKQDCLGYAPEQVTSIVNKLMNLPFEHRELMKKASQFTSLQESQLNPQIVNARKLQSIKMSAQQLIAPLESLPESCKQH